MGISLLWMVGALVILSMFSLSSSIVCFLREVHTATHTLHIGPPSWRSGK